MIEGKVIAVNHKIMSVKNVSKKQKLNLRNARESKRRLESMSRRRGPERNLRNAKERKQKI